MSDAQTWIELLQLQRHPEGGFYRETYRSAEVIRKDCLPPRFSGNRSFSTAIYFLLQGNDFSALHRIRQDEVWHFYDGSTVTVHVLDGSGGYRPIKLGRQIALGEALQAVVRAGCCFAATLDEPRSFALVGCTVAPGFDFADFELLSRQQLLGQFPQHRALIERLTRGP
jgi:predicted cupin superfamily sugar epimerase